MPPDMTFRDYGLLRRIWHRASGDYFDVTSERFDRHEDASKNIRDVSEPETGLLLHRHARTQSARRAASLSCECDSTVQASPKTLSYDLIRGQTTHSRRENI